MRHRYEARLKAAEEVIFTLNPEESLDRWIEEHYPNTRPSYLDLIHEVPMGLGKLCFLRGMAELMKQGA
jgi:hypothetical protein